MRIDLLYTEPPTIDPITFTQGVNVILGESDATSSKNNGVGKSMCVEFLNFALLKRKSESRVSKIPAEYFDPNTLICVDVDIHGVSYTIKRSINEAERPRIIVDGTETVYGKVDDATEFLNSCLFPSELRQVGFREILGPLIRDERSEFKSIVSCFDTKARVPDNYAPHLLLLGIDLGTYRAIKTIQKELGSGPIDVMCSI